VADVVKTETRGYSADKEALLLRLARIEGQVRGISKMVEEERYCIDILTQISAAQAAIGKVALGLVDGHVRHCMTAAAPSDPIGTADELMAAVGRFLKGG
jgi:DNA-binding FrmR family transcriptional regulator